MQTSQDLTSNEMTRFEAKLKNLEKEAIVLCATRAVLRVFPLLADKADNKDYFYYWSDKDKPKYLLAIWHALLINYSLSNKPISTSETIGSIPANGSFIASYIAYAAGRASAAKFARYGALAPAKESIVSAIEAASISIVNDKNIHFPDIKKELDRDLSQLKNKELSLFKFSFLWQKNDPEYINWLEKHLPEAFRQLSTEQEDRLTVGILNSIWPIYKGIFDGKPDQKAIDNALDQLEEYLFNKETDEAESNKLFYGKDDEPFYGKDDKLLNKRKNEPCSETKLEETEYDIESIAGNRHSSHQYAVEDKLNRQHLVNTLATLLQDQNNHHHQTIGLLGHWGVGKTSVVELLKTALKTKKQGSEPDFLFAEFNAWEYEHTDNLQAGIAQEMIKALSSLEPEPVCWKKACWPLRKVWLTARFALSLHGLKVLIPLSLFATSLAPLWVPDSLKDAFTSLVQPLGNGVASILPYAWVGAFLIPTFKKTKEVFAGPLAKELLTYLKLPNYGEHLGTIPVMREHIKKLTNVRLGSNKRLLYVVDDLDRCGHKGIVKVLEAVRMVLDLDNVIVVIAVDQRIALAALALNYKELATQHHIEDPRLIARDYLAKIIHLPIVLTEPDEASVSSYLTHLWEQTSSPESKALGEKADTLQQQDENSIKDNTSNTDEANQTDTIGQDVETKREENTPLRNTENSNTETTEIDFPVEQETAETPKDVKQVEQLTEPQKLAFAYWLKHFELSNPRQIKRLNNSFNLLRNLYPGEDKEPVEVASEEIGSEHAFPMMVTLFAFEYLNNLDDMQKRHSLKKLIKKEKIDSDGVKKKYLTGQKITPLVIELANLSLENTTVIKGVKPFVLPGIDIIDKTEEKTESS